VKAVEGSAVGGNLHDRPVYDSVNVSRRPYPVSSVESGAVISILLPYRDVASTIDEALDSVLAQRGVSVEVLAIDDGSRDDSAARVAKLATRHRAIVMMQAGGAGIARALELGRARARGEWIARMDGDDVAHPDRLRLQREELASNETLAAIGARVEAFPVENVGGGMLRYVAWQNSLLTPEQHARQLFVESPLCHPSVTLRASALARVGGWRKGSFPEDYDLWLRLDAAGFALAKRPETLLSWRHRAGRTTFADPRCHLDRLREAKAPFLARRVRALGRPLAVWGAGQTGRRMARALEGEGLHALEFIDVDAKKIGRRARGAPIVDRWSLTRGQRTLVVAAGAIGARDLIRAHLDAIGFVEGDDYLCAA
jgi:glycosyltransferase involved in cell wall biosynthesis